MSKRVGANITCPKCSKVFPVELYRTLWVEYPENYALVMNDEINAVTCPRCHFHTRLDFPFLCTNVKRGFAVWYEPYPDPEVDNDVAVYRAMMGPNSFHAKAPRISDWAAFKRKLAELDKNGPPDGTSAAFEPERMLHFLRQLRMQSPRLEPELQVVSDRLDGMFDSGLKKLNLYRSVEETEDFPFDDFDDTVKAIRSGVVNLSFGQIHPVGFDAVATDGEKTQQTIGQLVTFLVAPLALVAGVLESENYWLLLWAVLLFPLAFFGTNPHYKKAPLFLVLSGIGVILGLADGDVAVLSVSAFLFLCIGGYSFMRKLYNTTLIQRAMRLENAMMFLLGGNYLQLRGADWSLLWSPEWLKQGRVRRYTA